MTQPANKRLVTEAALATYVTNNAPTPASASTTAQGIVELATNTEATTGTDTARAVTPAGLAAVAATKQALQQVAATATANGAAVVNKHNPVDATTAARTITLPTGQAEGTQISVEKVDASANAVSVTGSIRGVGSSSIALSFLSESLMLRADSAGSWWPIAGHRTKVSLDAVYPLRTELEARTHPLTILTVRGVVNRLDANGATSFPARLRPPETNRRRVTVRNIGVTDCVVGYGTGNTANFNDPGSVFTVTVPPGSEYVDSGNEKALFAKPAVSGNNLSVIVEAELTTPIQQGI